VTHSASSSTTSHSLIQRARRNDDDAWVRLTRLYGPLVYRWARQCNLQPHDASDISQDVFRSVFHNIRDFDADSPGSTFRGWLWTITRNAVRGHFRSRQGDAVAMGGSDAHTRWEQLPELLREDEAPDAGDAGVQLVHRALEIIRDDFDSRTWTAFCRVALEERPTAEVAAELDMTPQGVRQAKYRVLCRLRETCEHL
jgi:RNA polymerase sigma-70 factor (ECF subfamily)